MESLTNMYMYMYSQDMNQQIQTIYLYFLVTQVE